MSSNTASQETTTAKTGETNSKATNFSYAKLCRCSLRVGFLIAGLLGALGSWIWTQTENEAGGRLRLALGEKSTECSGTGKADDPFVCHELEIRTSWYNNVQKGTFLNRLRTYIVNKIRADLKVLTKCETALTCVTLTLNPQEQGTVSSILHCVNSWNS